MFDLKEINVFFRNEKKQLTEVRFQIRWKAQNPTMYRKYASHLFENWLCTTCHKTTATLLDEIYTKENENYFPLLLSTSTMSPFVLHLEQRKTCKLFLYEIIDNSNLLRSSFIMQITIQMQCELIFYQAYPQGIK